MQYNTLPSARGQATQTSLSPELLGVNDVCVSMSPNGSQGDGRPLLLTPSHISPQANQPSDFLLLPGVVERVEQFRALDRDTYAKTAKPPKPRKSKPEPVRMKRSVDSSTGEIIESPDRDTGSFDIAVNGSLLKVSKPKGKLVSRPHGKRGQVMGFSNASRRRQMRTFASLDKSVLPLFVTLTYPLEFSVDYRDWKIHLDRFAKAFHRKFPDGALIWRLEPQKRGAPHYHMFLYGVVYTGENRAWIADTWYRVVGSEDIKHHRRGSDVQKIKSWNGAMSYASKYAAKVQDVPAQDDKSDGERVDWSLVGRWWGIRYRDNLPWSERFGGDGLSYSQSVKLLRMMRRYARSRGYTISGCLPGLTIFVDNPRQWANNIDGLIGGVHHTKHTYQSVSAKWQC